MRINNNLMAMNTHRQLGLGNTAGAKSMEKLSSGYRINRAGDDAAGLAISEKMRGQIRGLTQASRNAQDGISMIQTAEGALQETQAILQRMRELGVQSANDTNVAVDRDAIQNEMDQLVEEIDRIANTTEFNTKKLLNGNMGLSTTDADAIKKMNMTADTAAGTYTINTNAGITLGTKAASAAIATNANGLVTNAGTLTINGVDFTATATTTLEDLATDISNKVEGVTATYDSSANTFKIETDLAGASETLDISATADNIIGNEAYNGAALAATGTNLTGLTVDGVGGAFVADGNTVTITSGNAAGLSFEVTDNATTAATDITVGDAASLHIGANKDQTMSISVNAMDASNLGVKGIDITSTSSAEQAITTINDAIESVSTERAKLGAFQNRLEHTIKNLDTSAENLQASESRIRDVDMAKEMMNFTKNNILQQAAQAMLAQAQQSPQGVLQLLR